MAVTSRSYLSLICVAVGLFLFGSQLGWSLASPRRLLVQPESDLVVFRDPEDPLARGCNNALFEQSELLLNTYERLLRGRDYVAVVGFPDYPNRGDSAIWLGQQILLDRLNKTIVYACAVEADYSERQMRAALEAKGGAAKTAILFTGGGNFGDLYLQHQEIREIVVQDFPEYPIRAFPQSMLYQSKQRLEQTVDTYGEHPDLVLAARDDKTFREMERAFGKVAARIDLLPDLATMLIRLDRAEYFSQAATREVTYLWHGRTDHEASQDHTEEVPKLFAARVGGELVDIRDMEAHYTSSRGGWRRPQTGSTMAAVAATVTVAQDDWIDSEPEGLEHLNRDGRALARTQDAMRFLTRGELFVSDRLHAHILGTVWGLPHVSFETGDYGKIRHYDATWLDACRALNPVLDNVEDVGKAAAAMLAKLRIQRAAHSGQS